MLTSSVNGGQIGGDYSGGGGGGDLLSQLSQRVSDTLDRNQAQTQAQTALDGQKVRQGICALGQSLPGMGCNTVC